MEGIAWRRTSRAGMEEDVEGVRENRACKR